MRRPLVALVRLLPSPFRVRFGAEIASQLAVGYSAARAGGRREAAAFALAAALDLLRTALLERLDPTWIEPRAARAKERTMRGAVERWQRDLRQAGRALRRAPGFTAVAVGTLALAIGATAGIYTVVRRVLLEPLPYPAAERLMHVVSSAPGSDFPAEFSASQEMFVQYREQSKLVEELAAYTTFTNTLRTPDRVERIRMAYSSWTLLSTLGVRPLLGRAPVAEDDDRVALIGHALWRSWFGSDPAVVGKTFDIGGEPRTVIGVLPPEFEFPHDGTMLWISDDLSTEGLTPGRFGLALLARLKPGVGPEELAAELTGLSRGLPARFGGSPRYARLMEQHRAVVRPYAEELVGNYAAPLWVLLAAGGLVVLIACANVANLFLVRAEARQRDLAVRRAVGAAGAQLVRLQMSEALVVAILAGALAVGLAAVVLPVLVRAAPAGVPRLDDVGLEPASALFALGAAVVAALACGLVPALRAARPDLSRLREGGRGGTSRRRWARHLLVAGQTALALVLLIGSVLLLRSFAALRAVDPGYDTEGVLTFQFAPEQPALADGPSWARFHLDFLDRLAAQPGVESAGLVENVPLNESTAQVRVWAEGAAIGADDGTLVHVTFTAGDYFRTMGIALEAGRPFAADDHLRGTGAAVVSRAVADRLWPDDDPLGKRLRAQVGDVVVTVVGVVEDVRQDSFRDAPQALVYLPLAGPTPASWSVSSPAYVVKSSRADALAPAVRDLVRQVAPEAPVYRVFTMEGLARDSMVELSFMLLTLAIAAGLSLVLGTVGLYGVLSYVVAERAREIGVRMALGARAEQVRRMVVGQGARVVAVGIAVGLAGAFGATRALGSLLFGVAPVDVATFALTSLAMLGVGLLASYLPARRASRVSPLVSLRAE